MSFIIFLGSVILCAVLCAYSGMTEPLVKNSQTVVLALAILAAAEAIRISLR